MKNDETPLTPFGEAIAAGDGTLHGAIDYWQQQAFTMAAGQCCVRDGGLMADDHGHQFCDMERQRDELKQRAERAEARVKELEAINKFGADQMRQELATSQALREAKEKSETALAEAIGHADAMAVILKNATCGWSTAELYSQWRAEQNVP